MRIISNSLYLLFLLMTAFSATSQQTLHYEESFDDNTSGWAVWDNEWNSARFEKGQYLYELKGNYSHQTWNNGIRIDASRDFAIETRISLLSGKPGESSYWLEWGLANGGKDFFAFGIYSDGKFEYGRTVNGKWQTLVTPPVFHSAIQAGAGKTNLMRIERTGSSLVFLINGTEVHRASFESFNSSSATGFQANGQQRLAVDYLKVFQDPVNSLAANTVPAISLYPVMKKLDRDIELKSGYLFAGCVEGNCEDGTGTYLEVNCDRWNENKAKLLYKFYRGSFSQGARKFSGTIYYKDFLVDRKNTRKDLEPEKGSVDFSVPEKTCIPGESGEMKLSGTNDLFPGVRFYSRHGKSNGMMVRSNSVYAEGYFHSAEPVYMYLKDLAGNQFWGLVNHDFQKVAGYEKRVDGTVYTGGFSRENYFGPGRRVSNGKTEEGIWNRGGLVSAQPVYIPDTGLLKKAAMEIAGNLPIPIKLDPLNVDEYQDNGFGGRYYTEQGDQATFIANGNGLAMGYDHQFYIGHISNGRPDGMGFFATSRWGEEKYTRSTNVYGGYFEMGKFMVGPMVHKERIVEVKDVWGLFGGIREEKDFQEERDLIRKGEYVAARNSFREKAQKGVPKAQSYQNMFEEFIVDKEDFIVNKPANPALQKSMVGYFAGKPAEAFNAIRAEAGKGDAEALYYLAGFYEKGIGIEKNIRFSDSFYRMSVQNGYIRACMPLARKYLRIFEYLQLRGINFNLPDDDSAMKYYLIAAQSQPSQSISPAEIQESKMGYYRAKYPGLKSSIGVNIQLGDDANPNTYFGGMIAMDNANKQRLADLNAKISNASGYYYYHLQSHQILYVAPSAGGGGNYMVNATYIHYDNSRNFTSSVSVNDLLNPALYKVININETRTCSACKGEGVIRTAYKRTVADYEYTLGVKIEQSGTNTSGCRICGGGGLVH